MTKETLYISQHDSAVQYHGFTLSMVKKTFKVVVFHFFQFFCFSEINPESCFGLTELNFFDFTFILFYEFAVFFVSLRKMQCCLVFGGEKWHHLPLGCQVCLLPSVSLARLWLLNLNFLNFLFFSIFIVTAIRNGQFSKHASMKLTFLVP